MNIPTDEGGRIDIQNERIIIPIFFNSKGLDYEGMKKAFDECLDELDTHEEEVLKELN